MKRGFTLLFILFFSFSVYSQNNYEFVGFIKLNDSSLITLKVNFTEENGKIKGYTLSDVGGEHETKTSIEGEYNETKKVLSFKEVETIYTKSYFSENDFCFINFTSDRYRLGKSSKLTGYFKGLFPDKTECINGEIKLSTIEKYDKKIQKVDKVIKRSNRVSDSIRKNFDIAKTMDSIQMNVLRNKQTMSVFSKSKAIRIEIFDGGQIDGDKITVLFNNEIILKNFVTSADRKVIPLVLPNNKSTFILKANNVGTISTNTAIIEIFVDGSKIKALTNLNMGEQTQIDFYLKKII